MPRYLATRFEMDGEYGETVFAPSWEAAEKVCNANDWRLDGEVGAVIPASDNFGEEEAQAMVDALNESADSVKH